MFDNSARSLEDEEESVQTDYVITIIPENGGCDFDRRELTAKPGETVTFVNETSNPVKVSFTDESFFNTDGFSLDPGQKITLTVQQGTAAGVAGVLACVAIPGPGVLTTETKPIVIIYRR